MCTFSITQTYGELGTEYHAVHCTECDWCVIYTVFHGTLTLAFLAFQQQQLRVIGRVKQPADEKSDGDHGTETDSTNSESDEAKRRRTRTNFTQWQINELEKAFS